jgi:hypothetical protein
LLKPTRCWFSTPRSSRCGAFVILARRCMVRPMSHLARIRYVGLLAIACCGPAPAASDASNAETRQPVAAPKTQQDCESDEKLCGLQGLCSARNGVCVAASKLDCEEGIPCSHGACDAVDGRCVAKESTCAGELCSDHGMCRFDPVSKWCTVTDASCAASTHCDAFGDCGAVAVDGVDVSVCQPTASHHCRRSDHCKGSGTCALADSRCAVGSDEDCRNSTRCGYAGTCSNKQGYCGVVSDADCQDAAVCKKEGKCKAAPEQGRQPIRDNPLRLGACVAADDPATVSEPKKESKLETGAYL